MGRKLPGTIHLQGAPVVITALRGQPLYCHKTDELMQLSSEQLDLLAADGLEAICILLVSSLNDGRLLQGCPCFEALLLIVIYQLLGNLTKGSGQPAPTSQAP